MRAQRLHCLTSLCSGAPPRRRQWCLAPAPRVLAPAGLCALARTKASLPYLAMLGGSAPPSAVVPRTRPTGARPCGALHCVQRLHCLTSLRSPPSGGRRQWSLAGKFPAAPPQMRTLARSRSAAVNDASRKVLPLRLVISSGSILPRTRPTGARPCGALRACAHKGFTALPRYARGLRPAVGSGASHPPHGCSPLRGFARLRAQRLHCLTSLCSGAPPRRRQWCLAPAPRVLAPAGLCTACKGFTALPRCARPLRGAVGSGLSRVNSLRLRRSWGRSPGPARQV